MNAITLNSSFRFTEAHEALMEIYGGDNAFRARMDSLYELEANLKLKNPKKAKLMSFFVPGLGQMYSGKVGKGLLSLGLTGGFVALGVYAGINKHYIFALVSAMGISQRFWLGGARYAEFLAKQHNQELNSDYSKMLNLEILGMVGSELD